MCAFVCVCVFHALWEEESFSPFTDYTAALRTWLQLSRIPLPPPPFNVFLFLPGPYLISCDNNSNYLCFAPHSSFARRLALVVVVVE